MPSSHGLGNLAPFPTSNPNPAGTSLISTLLDGTPIPLPGWLGGEQCLRGAKTTLVFRDPAPALAAFRPPKVGFCWGQGAPRIQHPWWDDWHFCMRKAIWRKANAEWKWKCKWKISHPHSLEATFSIKPFPPPVHFPNMAQLWLAALPHLTPHTSCSAPQMKWNHQNSSPATLRYLHC